MLSGLLPLLRESPPYARIRGAVQERRPMWGQGPAGGALREPLVMGAPTIALLPVSGLLRRLPSAEQLRAERHQIRRGERLERDTLLALVAACAYERLPLVEARGQMAGRGGVIDLFPPTGGPYRIELSGDEVESLREFDPATQRSIREVEEVVLLPLREPGEGLNDT